MQKLITLILLSSFVLSSGGYDHGTSAGKGNFDLSLTWNPFNYFEQGQSYVVFGYGITDRFDIHGYYSHSNGKENNYYGGLFYQFLETKYLHLSGAIGIRNFGNGFNQHIFFPQLLYTINLTNKIRMGGSFVNINNLQEKSGNPKNIGIAIDAFLMYNIFENNKIKVNLSFGGFHPVLWEPEIGDFHPTYSLDFKFKV